ncbi:MULTISPECIES: sulfate ABC transporter permease subunit CysT [unclassified Phyllobacterium]|uniref:sulfate ABC transporter permease subunit CysT n=1 Tax=unclassified Phyllobacterium TaxID=2638441 RepID=UPI000484849B|nr:MULTISPECIES: sulfate ABC transporter permease subunit CysT [unclassified Phyllobacterium]SFJ00944.1 sulfate transport system permease protein [Phyllobacterium sp. CL33Tsu]
MSLFSRSSSRGILPGFGLTLGVTLLYFVVIVALPLVAMLYKSANLGFADFWTIVTSERALATYRITVSTAALATLLNAMFGMLLAWVLVRYEFPGRRLLDAIVDLPFALPTAVAGLALVTVFSANGWFGRYLEPLGIKVAYAPLGIALAMMFTSIPFVIRTVQPVLEDLASDVEEAARSLGASNWQIFTRVIWPAILPAFIAGCSLSFARSLGEFGAIVFISGNLPFETEVMSLLVFIRLDEYDYPAAAALATVMLVTAFLMLVITNSIQAWHLRYAERN